MSGASGEEAGKGRLRGKTALITGGGTGIGLGIALAFAREGCRVAIAGRREAVLREAAARWQGEPPLRARAADVADRESVRRLFVWAREELGEIDILVNAAGINIPRRSMAQTEADDWERILQVNATGAFLCMQAVLPSMRRRRDGVIINLSSISGKRVTLLGGAAYCASKFAMSALGLSAALEDGKNGVRVTNIYPGEVETPILEQRAEPVSAERRARMLQPEDLGEVALLVASLPPRAHIAEVVVKPAGQDYA